MFGDHQGGSLVTNKEVVWSPTRRSRDIGKEVEWGSYNAIFKSNGLLLVSFVANDEVVWSPTRHQQGGRLVANKEVAGHQQ